MKRLLASLLAFCVSVAFGATELPVQLLNPTGSTSGQAVISTGPTSAPGWGVPSACSGCALLSGATFTGGIGISYATPSLTFNGSGNGFIFFQQSGTNYWSLGNNPGSSSIFELNRYVSGTFTDSPISVSNSTGAVTMTDGIVSTPVSATTISASGLISPTSTIGIKGTTTNDSAQAGSVGERPNCVGTTVSLTNNTSVNICSMTLTAGDWEVYGSITFLPAGTTVPTQMVAGINSTSVTLPANPYVWNLQGTLPTGAAQSSTLPTTSYELTTSVTVYCVAQSAFTISTETASCSLHARRPR